MPGLPPIIIGRTHQKLDSGLQACLRILAPPRGVWACASRRVCGMQSADAPVSRCTSLHARDCVRLGPNLVYPFITALARPALHEFLSFVRVCFSAVLVAWTAGVSACASVRPSARGCPLCVISLRLPPGWARTPPVGTVPPCSLGSSLAVYALVSLCVCCLCWFGPACLCQSLPGPVRVVCLSICVCPDCCWLSASLVTPCPLSGPAPSGGLTRNGQARRTEGKS